MGGCGDGWCEVGGCEDMYMVKIHKTRLLYFKPAVVFSHKLSN